MMPPICQICDLDFAADSSKQGGLVSFALTPEEREHNKIFNEPGFVGHPDGLHWICGKHYQRAQELAHLTTAEAFPILKKEFLEQSNQDTIL
jgi:hypothetical protein